MIRTDKTNNQTIDVEEYAVHESDTAFDMCLIMDASDEYNDWLYTNEDIKIDHTSEFILALDSPEACGAAIEEASKLGDSIFDYQWHIIARRPDYSKLYFLLFKFDTDGFVSMDNKCDLNRRFHEILDDEGFHEDCYSGEFWQLEALLTEICENRYPQVN